ncbi:hypothetical protein [Fictibacillus fluitans]|uniref:Uncharacterized protein n=1 Tax=Fictibacillus fluitans TaxID=3058422 RepID=A0ABT8HQL8_9BACL|nr:hypothetical protein [Fictibacillus sp. NE201]MDN4523036.1 hypothetical protein [Fictibacillus sp. NE201]
MKRNYLWFLIPIVVIMVFMVSQLMAPVKIGEVLAVIIFSIISGSTIGLVLSFVNKSMFRSKRS